MWIYIPQDFCLNVVQEQVPQFKFYEEVKKFEKIDTSEDRRKKVQELCFSVAMVFAI